MWQTGQLTNRQFAVKFGLIYTVVSRRDCVFSGLLGKSKTLQSKLKLVKSLIKI